MKTFVIIFAIFICVGAMTHEELKTGIQTLQPICVGETGTSQKIIDEVYNGNVNVEDENVQSYVECMMKKFNVVDENGNFNEKNTRDIVQAVLDDNETDQLIVECSPISDANVHIKISKIFQCFMKYKTITDILNS
ncbi:odorant binding protein 16 precursor [Apis mellifera caucasica]|nr:odorant binding protein 16 precursor [Apis mellifera caucasica]KAG9428694.1 odorant binding protein 16 precursor [Apis mellifera carnica]